MKRVLAFLSVNPEYQQFAIPELKAMLSRCQVPFDTLLSQQLHGQDIKHHYQINLPYFKRYPFVVLKVPEFEQHRKYFQEACRQSVMVHRLILLISSGLNYEQLLNNADKEIIAKYCKNQEDKVVCEFNSRGRNISRQQQLNKIHSVLAGLQIKGQVDFKNPKTRYQLIQLHQWYQKHHLEASEKTMKQVFFGIELSRNHIATAKFNYKYELRKRIYLGPTSTDNDLAFMMCNQALVKQGSLVFDPFVGTGSLLIPPASKKAYIFGSELDIRVLNGYSVGRINKNSPFYDKDKKFELFTPKINLNFEQYGFPIPNLVRMDSTKLQLNAHEFFDAIITDPPYGIRAMSRTLKKQSNQPENKQQNAEVKQQEIVLSDSGSESSDELTNENVEKRQLTEEQKRKKERKRQLRENKKMRKMMLSQQQKNYKKDLYDKMNKQRVEQWQKFEKGKVQFTERDKIFLALLQLGRKYLKKQGRLVFLYPIYEDETYKGVDSLPTHEGFTVIDLSRNMMAKGNSRILVTLQKQ